MEALIVERNDAGAGFAFHFMYEMNERTTANELLILTHFTSDNALCYNGA